MAISRQYSALLLVLIVFLLLIYAVFQLKESYTTVVKHDHELNTGSGAIMVTDEPIQYGVTKSTNSQELSEYEKKWKLARDITISATIPDAISSIIADSCGGTDLHYSLQEGPYLHIRLLPGKNIIDANMMGLTARIQVNEKIYGYQSVDYTNMLVTEEADGLIITGDIVIVVCNNITHTIEVSIKTPPWSEIESYGQSLANGTLAEGQDVSASVQWELRARTEQEIGVGIE